jgi:lipopolysaccharide transport system permease protein
MRTIDKTVVYFPDKAIKQGFPSLFKEMVREIIHSRWLIQQFLVRDFSATYKQTILGIFWAFFVPLISTGTFIFLSSGGILDVGSLSIPYPLYAVAGTALWQFFSVGLTLSANSLVNSGSMVTRINFNRESLVISAIAQGFVPSLVQIVVLFILFASYQIMPPITVLLVPLAMIPLLLLTLGLGLILSIVNGVFRDVGLGISTLLTFLMFATPILYAKPTGGIVATISQYNPLYYLVSVPRDLLITGRVNELAGYLYSSLFALVLFLICWLAFHLAETRIAERI